MQKLFEFYPFILSIALALSLFLKHDFSSETSTLNHHEPLAFDQERFSYIRSIKPVNRGDFHIHFYGAKACDGILALLGLNKNEEGASILAHYLKKPVGEVRYIYKAESLESFPAFQYWLNSLMPMSTKTPVYAVAEFGRCDLIKKTDWSQI